MEIDEVLGLPAHPLLVHAPLVLIPLVLVAAVALTVRPAWRERGAVPFAAFAVLVGGLAVLAAGSGEPLEHRVAATSLVHDHAELGEQLRTIALLVAGAAVAWAVALRGRARMRWAPRLLAPLLALVVLSASLATVWDVRTGHAGAKAAWQDTADRPVAEDAD